jgi:GrpB-like predicted nucleotidyltransferase (UPF0157 family)
VLTGKITFLVPDDCIKNDVFCPQKRFDGDISSVNGRTQVLLSHIMIEINPYNPKWPQMFEDLAAIISEAMGSIVLRIEHVGSTAVTGLSAKPIIDIDVVINSYDRLPAAMAALAKLGYEHQGDLGIATRESFRLLPDTDGTRDQSLSVAHHLYVCPQDSPELARHIAFRDYLRSHPDAVEAYGKLKQDLARQFPDDRITYTEGKTEFVQAIYRQII